MLGAFTGWYLHVHGGDANGHDALREARQLLPREAQKSFVAAGGVGFALPLNGESQVEGVVPGKQHVVPQKSGSPHSFMYLGTFNLCLQRYIHIHEGMCGVPWYTWLLTRQIQVQYLDDVRLLGEIDQPNHLSEQGT